MLAVRAAPIYADITRGSTAAGCGSFTSPCSIIQDAVTKCPTGGTVWVAPGLYPELLFVGKINLAWQSIHTYLDQKSSEDVSSI